MHRVTVSYSKTNYIYFFFFYGFFYFFRFAYFKRFFFFATIFFNPDEKIKYLKTFPFFFSNRYNRVNLRSSGLDSLFNKHERTFPWFWQFSDLEIQSRKFLSHPLNFYSLQSFVSAHGTASSFFFSFLWKGFLDEKKIFWGISEKRNCSRKQE